MRTLNWNAAHYCAQTRTSKINNQNVEYNNTVAETWRRVWGDGKSFRGPKFLNDVFFFGKKFPFSRPKFLMTFFLVIDQAFLIFRIFTVLNVVYDPFFTRKTTISEKNSLMTPFLKTLFVLSRASDNTTFQNIGGTDAWAVPPTSNFIGGTVSLCPPRSPPLQ